MSAGVFILILVVAIAALVLMIVKAKMHPVLALFIAALGTGIALGYGVTGSVDYISNGFGGTLGSVGITIILGAIISMAIEDTGAGWVMPDHNLYYSVKPDGTYVEGDYPYLTYNDLLHLRKYLTGFGRTENETLTYLMSEKLQWMQSHGVTGYEKD